LQSVTLSLFRVDGLTARAWVLGQMGAARPALARVPGLSFYKLCGSGSGEGFTPRPNWGVWAILGVWDNMNKACEGVQLKPFSRWVARARESYTVFLEPATVRGHWAGARPFRPAGTLDGPIAALTRATIRPSRAVRFWGRVPDISATIGADPNVRFKIGIGEVPLLHQVTFSVWPDTASMAAFARRGAHADAIRAVRDEGWFTEELYARFRLCATQGSWHGTDPLAATLTKDAA